MEEQIKAKRVAIDGQLQLLKMIPIPNRETSLAYTAMQKGVMYLGLMLGALGQANPYPESTNAASPVIESPTDKATDIRDISVWHDRIAGIKQMRSDIQDILDIFKDWRKDIVNTRWIDGYDAKSLAAGEDQEKLNALHIEQKKFEQDIVYVIKALDTSTESIIDAKLWLGQELNNIRVAQQAEAALLENITAAEYEAGNKAYDQFYGGSEKPYDWLKVTAKEKIYWVEKAKIFAGIPGNISEIQTKTE